jgi:very-short-patch-repair endonuclease
MAGQSERAAAVEGDESLSRRAWTLGRRQHGVLTRKQLLSLGLSRHGIEHRLARGRLHPLATGVYAVGRPELTQHGRWMAAVLSCGPGSMLSHGSAAALWGIGSEHRGIEITAHSANPRRRPGLRVYRRPTLAARNVTSQDGIPVTGIVQTLVDLAATLRPQSVERAVNEADRLDLIHPPALRVALEVHRCEPGVRPLRALLDRRTFRLTRSELERIFLPMTAQVGLPLPLTKQWVNGFEVDFFWPDLAFVVETDGLRHHRTPAQQAKDRRRDQAHTAAGMIQLRFTHEQIYYEPDYVRGVLAATVRAHKLDRR